MSAIEDKINRLPKWAAEYIRGLERERDEANRLLQVMADDQTPTPVFTTDLRGREPSIGDKYVRRYFDPCGSFHVDHAGILLTVMIPDGIQGRYGIELEWSAKARRTGDVIFQPTSFQAARLILPGCGE